MLSTSLLFDDWLICFVAHLVDQPCAKAELFQPTRRRDLFQQKRQQCPHFLKRREFLYKNFSQSFLAGMMKNGIPCKGIPQESSIGNISINRMSWIIKNEKWHLVKISYPNSANNNIISTLSPPTSGLAAWRSAPVLVTGSGVRSTTTTTITTFTELYHINIIITNIYCTCIELRSAPVFATGSGVRSSGRSSGCSLAACSSYSLFTW